MSSGYILRTVEIERDCGDGMTETIPLSVYAKVRYLRGLTYGPPEDCYPPEFDIEIVTIHDAQHRNFDVTDAECEEIVDYLMETYQDAY